MDHIICGRIRLFSKFDFIEILNDDGGDTNPVVGEKPSPLICINPFMCGPTDANELKTEVIPAPDEPPPIVILSGSPPNDRIFLFIHSKATSASYNPILAWY